MRSSPPTYQGLKNKLKIAEKKIEELQKIVSENQNNFNPNGEITTITPDHYHKILADNSTDLVGILNMELKFIYLSPSVKSLTGYSQDEGKGLSLNDFLSHESAKLALESHKTCIEKGGCPNRLDLKFKKKDGSSFIAEVITKPIINNKGELLGIHASCRDISDRVNLENKLKIKREWSKLVFSSLNDRILVFNKTGNLVFSSYLPIWFHPDHPQFMNDPVFNPIHPDDMSMVTKVLKNVFETGKGGRMDYRSKGKGEDYKWVEGNGNLVKFPGTNEPYLINVVRDIDDRKRLENELSNTIKTKDKLFSIIAHDLKSPFNALIGFSKELAENYDDYDEDTRKKFIGIISSTSKNTFKLLTNLLDWSRIQTGSIKINKVKFCLNDLINRCIAIYENVAHLKQIKISTNFVEPRVVSADQTTIATVIENLINNAIKFSNPGGEIQIYVEDSNAQVHLSIKDSGIGMDDNLMAMLFKIDQEVSRRGTNNEKGTGLGLVLCKEFIEINGGKIWVESSIEKGSTFSISIPKE